MQVIPDQRHDGEETGDGTDEEAAVDEAEIFNIFVLLQENLQEKEAAGFVLCFS